MGTQRPLNTAESGSIVPLPDGRWLAVAAHQSTPVSRYAASRQGAALILARLLAEEDIPAAESGPLPTLAEWAEAWLALCAKTRRPTTCDTYRKSLA